MSSAGRSRICSSTSSRSSRSRSSSPGTWSSRSRARMTRSALDATIVVTSTCTCVRCRTTSTGSAGTAPASSWARTAIRRASSRVSSITTRPTLGQATDTATVGARPCRRARLRWHHACRSPALGAAVRRLRDRAPARRVRPPADHVPLEGRRSRPHRSGHPARRLDAHARRAAQAPGGAGGPQLHGQAHGGPPRPGLGRQRVGRGRRLGVRLGGRRQPRGALRALRRRGARARERYAAALADGGLDRPIAASFGPGRTPTSGGCCSTCSRSTAATPGRPTCSARPSTAASARTRPPTGAARSRPGPDPAEDRDFRCPRTGHAEVGQRQMAETGDAVRAWARRGSPKASSTVRRRLAWFHRPR